MDVIGNSRVSQCREPSMQNRPVEPDAPRHRTIKVSGIFSRKTLVGGILPFLVFILILAMPAFAQPTAPFPHGPEPEVVHFGDLIDVDVLGGFEYDWRGNLNPDGNLDVSDGYAEPIYALCRTETQIASDIIRVLGKILRDPKVVVKILDRSNRALARIDGAVRTPTRFQIKRQVRLRELIVMAGGLVDGASGEVSIFRPRDSSCKSKAETETGGKDNASQLRTIKISDLLSGSEGSDPIIFSGDLVTVSKALPVYIIGAIVNPRPIYSREKMTLSRMISSAGGLTKEADSSKVFIFRRSGLEVKAVEADLDKIKTGERNDEILEPFDIIEVAAKGGVKRKYPPVMANDRPTGPDRANMPLRIVE